MDNEMVTLKNGEDAPRAVVTGMMMKLEELSRKNPMALFELREFCRDSEHSFFRGAAEELVELGFLSPIVTGGGGYWMHDADRAVVLSAVVGEELDVHVASSPEAD